MLKNVLNQQISFGRISLILLFVGGLVFAGTYNGFVVETEAQTSCCGSTDAPTAETSCCGSGTEVSKLSNAEVGDCSCIPDGDNMECSYCKEWNECGPANNSCHEDCKQEGKCEDCSKSFDCVKGPDKCDSDNDCVPIEEWTGRTE